MQTCFCGNIEKEDREVMCGTSGSLIIRKIPLVSATRSILSPVFSPLFSCSLSLTSFPPSARLPVSSAALGLHLILTVFATVEDRSQVQQRSQELPCKIGQCLGEAWPFSDPDQVPELDWVKLKRKGF